MFRTQIGPVDESATEVFLRPETAQSIFMQYRNIQLSSRQRIPFGIAQIGKAFRNEVTPGNFIFRLLEFEQMEIEYFIEDVGLGASLRGVAACSARLCTIAWRQRRTYSRSRARRRGVIALLEAHGRS